MSPQELYGHELYDQKEKEYDMNKMIKTIAAVMTVKAIRVEGDCVPSGYA